MKALSKLDAELLHRYLDGEVSEEERKTFEARLGEDAELRSRWEAGREIGGLVRAYAAYGLDQGAPRLGGLVEDVENALDPGGTTAVMSRKRAAASAPRAGKSRRLLWATAAMAVAAAAVIMLVLGPLRHRDRGSVAEKAPAPSPVQAVALAGSNQADIEELDVPSSAAVFTIPDDQGDNSTTVIWVSDPDPPTGGSQGEGPQ